MKNLDSYDYKSREQYWRSKWQEDNIYKYIKGVPRNKTYSIDTPPPTVSGQLHMGHILSYTQADFIARYQRMKGMNVFYPIGFDDNGLPTERLVEKMKNIRASNMPRQEFIRNCHDVIEVEEEKFASLFLSIGLSVDWSLKYQTISDSSRAISQLSFLDLVEKSEIYRAEKPVLWDPLDQTALAQVDIEDKEKNSEMHNIAFKTAHGDELLIATTRPELLPACVCLLFHPEDTRYRHLENSRAFSPLFEEEVPIIPDPLVKQDKGTGLVMCCTFGDTTDIAWWMNHKLPLKIMLDKSGRICKGLKFNSRYGDNYFNQIIGMKVTEARAKILELLRESKLLKTSVPISQTVKCAERSGAPLEIITTPQWFVRTTIHKEALIARSQELEWHPINMKIKLDNWINGVSWDWCISRQRFFGVPFPVWYSLRKGEEGKPIFANKAQLPVDPLVDLPEGYSRDEVVADEDVMDTWATSAVSPQLATKAINEKYHITQEDHANLFPFDLRPQAHEILRSWAFYTILKSHLHSDSLPWSNIMVSGWCLASDKTKMSKSKGNIVSPVSLIENYSADVIRYWASNSHLGHDTAFSEELLKIGKKLVNKLWNASKFASNHFKKIDTEDLSLEKALQTQVIFYEMDLWLITRLIRTIDLATSAYEKYEYAEAIEYIESFFWKDFCDNYLEISKARCYNENGMNDKGQMSGIYTLYFTLKNILILFAPVMPYITEEIYSSIYTTSSIHDKNIWPDISLDILPQAAPIAESMGNHLIDILNLVRRAKAEKNLSIKSPIKELSFAFAGKFSENSIQDLMQVTNSTKISLLDVSDTKKYDIYSQIVESDTGDVIGVQYFQ
ncbi:MAG: valine--tRNA ligase [Alphaproteobacteria bacterium]|nr:valine--tRNA ligase [Alphaproteobacteria bacterium]